MNGKWIQIEGARCAPLPEHEQKAFETLDAAYRALCAMLYNYAPLSGHPGGSISSGRIVEQLLFGAMDYDVARPDRDDADVLSYAAGHKALGLYSILALQNEIVRLTNPSLLPRVEDQLRFEDLREFSEGLLLVLMPPYRLEPDVLAKTLEAMRGLRGCV